MCKHMYVASRFCHALLPLPLLPLPPMAVAAVKAAGTPSGPTLLRRNGGGNNDDEDADGDEDCDDFEKVQKPN